MVQNQFASTKLSSFAQLPQIEIGFKLKNFDVLCCCGGGVRVVFGCNQVSVPLAPPWCCLESLKNYLNYNTSAESGK